jgi:GT2 family glycosyltransferase
MIKIVSIVVTYNGMKWIEDCLSSLNKSSLPIDIIVIDNNSSDQTVSCIKSKFPDVILFEQMDNIGFGKANNIGMTYALKQNADFVFLLNQDAFVNKNSIENLVRVAQKKPEYGVLSPIQLDCSGKLLEAYFFKFMAEDSSRSFYSDFVLGNQLKEIYDINFIQAAAWLMPKKTLLEIGGFDPVFFHYGEDDNYCHRLLYHNFKIGVVANTFIRHDSREKPFNQEKPFSEKYLKNYNLSLLVKYCNINIVFTNLQIRKEKKKIYKAILVSVIKLNLSTFLGHLKKLRLLNSNIIKIIASRKINKKIRSNYLYD